MKNYTVITLICGWY